MLILSPTSLISLTLVYLYMQRPTRSLFISWLSIWSCHTTPFLSTFNILCNSLRRALSQTLLRLPGADSSLQPNLPTEGGNLYPRHSALTVLFHIPPRRLTISLFNTSTPASQILVFHSLTGADRTLFAACIPSPIVKRKKKNQRYRAKTRGWGILNSNI